ncbi:ABC transporter permease [Candidatus Kaiserbacteria bacterium]|nr:ABC transporter permease [Candidatus Kaiserbacteria bacterium]
MNPRRIYAVFLRYMLLLWGSPQRLFQIVIWGSFDVIVFGYLTKYLNAVSEAQFSLISALLGGIIFLDILARFQHGVATPVLEDIWSNNLLNYFASPLRVSEYILGLIGSSIVVAGLATAMMVFVAQIVFGFSLFTLGMPLALFMLILFFFGIALGIFGATIVLRFGPSAEWFVWPMTFVLSPFVGVLYPISILPQWMQAISSILAPSYVFEGMRSILISGEFSPSGIGVGLVLSVATVAIAQFIFMRTYKTVVKKGLLARYSAETL